MIEFFYEVRMTDACGVYTSFSVLSLVPMLSVQNIMMNVEIPMQIMKLHGMKSATGGKLTWDAMRFFGRNFPIKGDISPFYIGSS